MIREYLYNTWRISVKKWEYKCVFIAGTDARIEKILNDYGKDGWELVCINFIWSYYFKRAYITPY